MAAATAPMVAALVGRAAAAADPHLRGGRVRVGVRRFDADIFYRLILEEVCEVLWFCFGSVFRYLLLLLLFSFGHTKKRGYGI